jgi:hypothetical protein
LSQHVKALLAEIEVSTSVNNACLLNWRRVGFEILFPRPLASLVPVLAIPLGEGGGSWAGGGPKHPQMQGLNFTQCLRLRAQASKKVNQHASARPVKELLIDCRLQDTWGPCEASTSGLYRGAEAKDGVLACRGWAMNAEVRGISVACWSCYRPDRSRPTPTTPPLNPSISNPTGPPCLLQKEDHVALPSPRGLF